MTSSVVASGGLGARLLLLAGSVPGCGDGGSMPTPGAEMDGLIGGQSPQLFRRVRDRPRLRSLRMGAGRLVSSWLWIDADAGGDDDKRMLLLALKDTSVADAHGDLGDGTLWVDADPLAEGVHQWWDADLTSWLWSMNPTSG